MVYLHRRGSVQIDLHVASEVAVEAGHAVGLDVAIVGGIEVLEALVEVFVQVVFGILALEAQMRVEDLVGSHLGLRGLEHELTGRLAIRGGELERVVVNHGPHEHVIAGVGTTEILRNLPIVLAEALKTLEVVVAGLEARMRIVLVPHGGDRVLRIVELEGSGASQNSLESHYNY